MDTTVDRTMDTMDTTVDSLSNTFSKNLHMRHSFPGPYRSVSKKRKQPPQQSIDNLSRRLSNVNIRQPTIDDITSSFQRNFNFVDRDSKRQHKIHDMNERFSKLNIKNNEETDIDDTTHDLVNRLKNMDFKQKDYNDISLNFMSLNKHKRTRESRGTRRDIEQLGKQFKNIAISKNVGHAYNLRPRKNKRLSSTHRHHTRFGNIMDSIHLSRYQ